MQYFFILGRNPELSLAELHAVLPTGYQTLGYCQEVLAVECSKLNEEELMARLGGTIKIGEIIGKSPTAKVASEKLSPHLALQDERKIFFGLSAYAFGEGVRLPNVHGLRQLGIELKRLLQEEGHKVRLVTSKEIALSSVIVKKEKLITQGAEIVLLYSKDGVHIGKTSAVQEFEEASARDFGRPMRSMQVGMLPIQLAKIMVNLSCAPLSATLLDPFCGLGTVLTEAAQMGYQNLVGSDLEQKMIDATRVNLKWLQERFSIGDSKLNIRLVQSPVEQVAKHLSPNLVDAIITEPYLGPTRERTELKSLILQLSTLYIAAFREFAKIMKRGGRVVFILPAFKSGAQLTKTSEKVLPEIKKLGFEPTNLLPNNLITQSLNPSVSILYSRPDQKVLREIFVLDFKPKL